MVTAEDIKNAPDLNEEPAEYDKAASFFIAAGKDELLKPAQEEAAYLINQNVTDHYDGHASVTVIGHRSTVYTLQDSHGTAHAYYFRIDKAPVIFGTTTIFEVVAGVPAA